VPNRRQREDLESRVGKTSSAQRAKIVKAVLARGEDLAADPAVALCQLVAPEKSLMLGLAEEGFLFATDRRLLYRTASGSVTLAWPYDEIAEHRLRRCTETRLVCALPATSRLRGHGWGFATLTLTTVEKDEFAIHGSRPFLAAIASVLSNVDVNALPRTSTTTEVWSTHERAGRENAAQRRVAYGR